MKMEKSLAINLMDVSKHYGDVAAVQNVTLNLMSGECVALVGHNGAGKSTLIKMILGLIRPSVGTARVLHTDPASRAFNPLRRRIGFLPEQLLFQKSLTGRETLQFYARLKGCKREDLDRLFTRVDLAAAADRRVGTYSKGMRQRLGMAQALIGGPKLLVLDEPTTGLDPMARQNIYRIIDEEKSGGATVLISSHVLTELDERIDRVAILAHGRMVAEGGIPFLRQNIGMKLQMLVVSDKSGCDMIAEAFAKRVKTDRLSAEKIMLSCPPEDKVPLLREIMALELNIDDIRLIDASLEQVFNAYSGSDDGGQH